MDQTEWSEDRARAYCAYMETVVRHDHRKWARAIAADWPGAPAGATVVDIASGPGFLLLELAPLLREPRLIVQDASPVMAALALERAARLGHAVAIATCPAERLAMADDSADLVLCKHFLRLAADPDGALRESARILRPGGRAYFVDFDGTGPRLGGAILWLWIRLTAPPLIREGFWRSLRSGLPAAGLPARLAAAGFRRSQILRLGVSYLVRAEV